MNAVWREPVLPKNYAVYGAIDAFAEFVVSTSSKPGWQGRVVQRWDREMARLIEYQTSKGGFEGERTALNYVYGFRTKVRDLLEELPSGDPRREIIDDLDSRLATPQVFTKADDRIPLNQSLKDFSEVTARLAIRGWKNWLDDLEAKWVLELAAMSSKAETTQKNYISRYRKAIEEEFERNEDIPEGALDEVFKVVKHIPKVTKSVNNEYSTTVRKQVRNLQLIENWKELVKVFNEFLVSDNPRLRLIGLMGVTGRRFYEVCASGDFSLEIFEYPQSHVTVKQKWVIRFIGQAKTKGREGTMSEETYNIPCLASAKDVCSAFQWLRNSPEGKAWSQMSSRELNARVNNQINRYLRSHEDVMRLWPKGVKLTTKCLRSLYAEISYKVFAPGTMAKAPYFAQILGHSAEDLNTALSYMDYVLDPSDEEVARNDMQALIDATNERDAAYGKPWTGNLDQDDDFKKAEQVADDGMVIDDDDI